MCCLLLLAVQTPATFASANANWGPGREAVLPAGAMANPYSLGLPSVSCPAPGDCTAVGHFLDGSSHYQGLVLGESAGSWRTGVPAGLPNNAGTDPNAGLSWVACASVGNCTAVGYYHDSSHQQQGLLLGESSGSWAKGVPASLPGNAGPNPAVNLEAVSCASPGNCTAVGSYTDNMSHVQGLLLGESSGTWSAGVEAILSGGGTNPFVALSSVSCASAGNCTAVGSYVDSAGHNQGLLLTESAGTWDTGLEATLPNSVGANPGVILASVSCASAGNCTAVGHYLDAATNPHGAASERVVRNVGRWDQGTAAGQRCSGRQRQSVLGVVPVSGRLHCGRRLR